MNLQPSISPLICLYAGCELYAWYYDSEENNIEISLEVDILRDLGYGIILGEVYIWMWRILRYLRCIIRWLSYENWRIPALLRDDLELMNSWTLDLLNQFVELNNIWGGLTKKNNPEVIRRVIYAITVPWRKVIRFGYSSEKLSSL